MKIYLVGGAVRDKLLNKPKSDNDYVVVGSTSKEMLQAGYQKVGRCFPVFLHPRTGEEYALARREYKYGTGYHGFKIDCSQTVSLHEDLMRRDLTINAMAIDAHGELIDPYGGQQDLKEKILRHISSAFSEDPLRILRVARFAAQLNFNVASKTQKIIQQMIRCGELKTLVSERVFVEIKKSLVQKYWYRFWQVLWKCGVQKPLLFEGMFIWKHPFYNNKDLQGTDELARISCTDPWVRMAMICHALKKEELENFLAEWHIANRLRKFLSLCHGFVAQSRQQKLSPAEIIVDFHKRWRLRQDRKIFIKFLKFLRVFRKTFHIEEHWWFSEDSHWQYFRELNLVSPPVRVKQKKFWKTLAKEMQQKKIDQIQQLLKKSKVFQRTHLSSPHP